MEPMDPVTARRVLLDGYTRFVTGRPEHPDQTDERRAAVAAATAPIAAILGCADARVPPEVIFDQGFGDLFVVRIAGAVVTDAVLGSIEVAVRDMAVPLLVVLGHTRCLAVQAALSVIEGDGEAVGHAGALIEALIPAVDHATPASGSRLDAAIRAHIRLSVEHLQGCEPVLASAVRSGGLEVAGWLYDVDTGIIEMIA